MNNKLICFLLLILIISSSILVYKIELSEKYNENIHAQVYKEYEEIVNINNFNQLNNIIKNPIIFNHSSTTNYRTIGIINIPKINISYPIINECTEENLKIAPTKLAGPTINTIGNLVVIAHNNWNKEFFSNLHKLENGDIVELTDTIGKPLTYTVYDKYEIKQDDFSCLEQKNNEKIELTLITCIKYQKTKRLVIKCIAN